MAASTRSSNACNRCMRQAGSRLETRRLFSHSARSRDAEVEPATTSTSAAAPPASIDASAGPPGVGPRRRRVLMQQLGSSAIPFDQMPYQCFQEARKVLRADREVKLVEIAKRREKISRLQSQETAPQDEAIRERKLKSLKESLEELKINADINDPMVKKKFEDGQADLSKPIYRYLADRKWREYKRKIVMQRVEQMHVIPDVMPHIDPVVSTEISFGSHKISHGQIVNSGISQTAPSIKIQPYDHGVRLYTIAFINPDVPNVSTDSFSSRCHFLAVNVPVSPTLTEIDLAALSENQVVLPWLPPYVQKGLKYQRLAVCIFEQPRKEESVAAEGRSQALDVAAMKAGNDARRGRVTARALGVRHRLMPVGIDLIRTEHDEDTDAVMERAGIIGVDVEFKRKRTEPLPYKRMKGERYR